MKHRYIKDISANKLSRISDFLLKSRIDPKDPTDNPLELIRVSIPNDLKLIKSGFRYCDMTFDDRVISQLNYHCYILYEDEWRQFDYLKDFKLGDWEEVLKDVFRVYRVYSGSHLIYSRNPYYSSVFDLHPYEFTKGMSGRLDIHPYPLDYVPNFKSNEVRKEYLKWVSYE